MDLMVKEIGCVTIKNAAKTEYGDIEVFSDNSFAEIVCKTHLMVKSAYLIEDDFEWCLYIDIDLPDELIDEMEPWLVYEIENQGYVYRLKAFL
jgi:hypothetical protein